MTEQELREQFENNIPAILNLLKKRKDSGEYLFDHIEQAWQGYQKGYSLAQKTIKSKNDLIEMYHQEISSYIKTIEKHKKEIEELQKRSYKYYGLSEQLKLDKKHLEVENKTKDMELEKVKTERDQYYDKMTIANVRYTQEREKNKEALNIINQLETVSVNPKEGCISLTLYRSICSSFLKKHQEACNVHKKDTENSNT